MPMPAAVIVDAVRTPVGRGKPGGSLSGVHPVDLLSLAIRSLLERTDVDPEVIDDVIGGCVDQVGEQAINTTRWAVLGAGLPETIPATTVDRQCGSSQQAIHFAAQGIMSGAYEVVVACGIESMSQSQWVRTSFLARIPLDRWWALATPTVSFRKGSALSSSPADGI